MNTRTKLLAMVLFEGVTRLVEADQPLPQQPAPQPAPQPQPQQAQPQAAPTPTSGLTGGDGQPLTIDSVIERLNVIRGGKSFSDPGVYSQLTAMFNGMTDQDKLALDKTLGDVGAIVMAPAEEQQQSQPSTTGTPPQNNPSGVGQPPPAASTAPPAAMTAPAPQQGAAPAGM